MTRTRRTLGLLCTASLLLAASIAQADPQPGACAVPIIPDGQFVSLSGSATTSNSCGESRSVSCGSSLFAGETVSTGAGGSAGLMVGDVLVVLGASSEARIEVSQGGAPEVTLLRGAARVIDPRESGPPARLAAGAASASFLGNDAEARIDAAGATLCGWDGALEVSRAGSSSAERCTAEGRSGSGVRLAVSDAGRAVTCEARPSIAAALDLVPLPQVAGGPAGFGPALPATQSMPRRSPCDIPGSGCGRLGGSAPTVTVVEQPPGNLPFPGGTGGGFPGGGGLLP